MFWMLLYLLEQETGQTAAMSAVDRSPSSGNTLSMFVPSGTFPTFACGEQSECLHCAANGTAKCLHSEMPAQWIPLEKKYALFSAESLTNETHAFTWAQHMSSTTDTAELYRHTATVRSVQESKPGLFGSPGGHPASWTAGTARSFPGVERAGAWDWALSTI